MVHNDMTNYFTNNIKKNDSTNCCWIVLASVVSLVFPLHGARSILIIMALLGLLVNESRVINRKTALRLVLLLSVTILYFCNYFFNGDSSLLIDKRYISVVISVVFLIVVSIHMDTYKAGNHIGKNSLKVYTFAYWLLYGYCFLCLVDYILHNRFVGADPNAFHYGFDKLHYVDFGIICFFLFVFGYKMHRYRSSFLFALLCFILLPARVYKLLILCSIMLLFFKRMVRMIKRRRLFNSYFKITMVLLVGTIIFAWVWVFVLPQILQLKSSHYGLFDSSNLERFESDLYSIRVIIQERLWFKFLKYNSWKKYNTLAKTSDLYFVNIPDPHNSILLMMLYYSVIFTIIYIFLLSKVFDKLEGSTNDAFILAYLLSSCILHDLLDSNRIVLLVFLLMIPEIDATDKHIVVGNKSLFPGFKKLKI